MQQLQPDHRDVVRGQTLWLVINNQLLLSVTVISYKSVLLRTLFNESS
jgi:hypothetical protein